MASPKPDELIIMVVPDTAIHVAGPHSASMQDGPLLVALQAIAADPARAHLRCSTMIGSLRHAAAVV